MDGAKVRDEISVLLVPPWENAGEDHWMSLWQDRDPSLQRVEQDDWNSPDLKKWSDTLVDRVRDQRSPVILVSHSLGAVTVVHSMDRIADRVAAALLVAPPDVEHPMTPEEIRSFAPLPHRRIPFRTVLVASENDVYASIERSAQFADTWGSEFVNVGAAGHINPRAGFGEWKEGERILSELIGRVVSEVLPA